jgi:hypothetical protein
MDKLAEIGEYLVAQGKTEFADHIAKMMVEQKKEKWVEKPGSGKIPIKISGWGEPDDYDSEQDYVEDSEEDVNLSEEEGNAVPEDLEVKVDAEGFQSLA